MICQGHSIFEHSVNRSDSRDAPDYEKVKIKALNISLSLVENWSLSKLNNPNAIEIQHVNSNSKVIISTTDSNELLYEIFSEASEQEEKGKGNLCMDPVSPEMLVNMVGKAGKFPNGKITISTHSSTTEDGYDVISVRTVINTLGFKVNGKLDQNCSACKSEMEYMIQSIKELK